MALGPTPRIAERTLDLVLLVDVSGSMRADAKIQSLNAAIEEAVPFLRRAATELVGIAPRVRVLSFGSSVTWAVEEPVALEEFWWPELAAAPGALTELGAALSSLRAAMADEQPDLPPAVVLITDGMPTDTVAPTFAAALAAFDADQLWGSSARAAIAIGDDADHSSLEAFVARAEGDVMRVDDPRQLADVLRVASTSVLRAASAPVW